jgi:FtsZ-interacting cell division protein YlmF
MDVDSDDDDVELGSGKAVLEDQMPPKMRKRWIRGAVEKQRGVEEERREQEREREREREEQERERERQHEREREKEREKKERESMPVDKEESGSVPGAFGVERWSAMMTTIYCV